MIRAYAVYETIVLGHYSYDRDKIGPRFLHPRPRPSTLVKLQGRKHATLATGPGMTGRVTTTPKDRNHSPNSGDHA
jgi:hypothetical protein